MRGTIEEHSAEIQKSVARGSVVVVVPKESQEEPPWSEDTIAQLYDSYVITGQVQGEHFAGWAKETKADTCASDAVQREKNTEEPQLNFERIAEIVARDKGGKGLEPGRIVNGLDWHLSEDKHASLTQLRRQDGHLISVSKGY